MLAWLVSTLIEERTDTVPFADIHNHELGVALPHVTQLKKLKKKNKKLNETDKFGQVKRNFVIEGKPKFDMIPEERRKVPTILHKLRYDWTNLEIKSPIAQRLNDHQSNCDLPIGNFQWRKKIFGLGSDIHIWGQALCNAMEEKLRIRTHNVREWIWLDGSKCDMEVANKSGLLCYFPSSELRCPQDAESIAAGIVRTIPNPIKVKCDSIMKDYNISDFRAAAVEVLFTKLSPIVVTEGERQLNLVFPNGVPKKLITVHMRWGDKKFESKLQDVMDYINGVKQVLKQRGDREEGEAHIYLATEDPQAVTEFMTNLPKLWKVYLDQFYYEMLPYRPSDDPYNTVPKISRELNGVTGLWSLGSLLVAMEANDYVLTTSSNWSRLMNELRKNIVNPRQNDQTKMVDLKYGEW
jgi:hypothetical protein